MILSKMLHLHFNNELLFPIWALNWLNYYVSFWIISENSLIAADLKSWLQIIMCNMKFPQLLLNCSKHYHLIVTTWTAVLFVTRVLITLWHLHKYIYAFIGLLWCSIMNMNSILVAIIILKAHIYFFVKVPLVCDINWRIQDYATRFFLPQCITFMGIAYIYYAKGLFNNYSGIA